MSADWRIEVGDCRDVLRAMPAGSVHTVVTSPPYFGLRDYGTDGQIGLEPTPDEFVAALVDVFREVRRVLRDDGTVWLNLGDSYSPNWTSQRGDRGGGGFVETDRKRWTRLDGYKPKDLLGIPWMVAFALRADGWYLRSDIVWSKPNPMPESVTDRPTKAHEYVFLLSKGPRYFYDADAIREPYAPDSEARNGRHPTVGVVPDRNDAGGFAGLRPGAGGANKRSVWTVATQPYAGAHFATFPPKLIEPCILAGAPERACGECGAPWLRVVENYGPDKPNDHDRHTAPGQTIHRGLAAAKMGSTWTRETLGFEPSCTHGDGSARGVVLDPFAGAGTTGLVALQHGRGFVGIELNPEYARMARDRIETAVRLGFRGPQRERPAAEGQGALFEAES